MTVDARSTADADAILSVFRFEVVISSGQRETWIRRAAFSEVSGLETQLAVEELREGGYHAGVRRLVGKRSNSDLVLKRGVTLDAGFWAWLEACSGPTWPIPYVSGLVRIHPPSVQQRESSAAELRFWNAIPTRVRMAELRASGRAEVAIEELHLAHEGLERVR